MVSGRNADVGESSMAKRVEMLQKEHDRVLRALAAGRGMFSALPTGYGNFKVLVFRVVALCVGWFSEPKLPMMSV